ncbi:MAG TPA: hypothetical protein VF168_12075 [Trueperaceae bacterium]
MDWIVSHSQLVSSLVTIATLVVWLVWLQLMYNDYRSRRQPRMLIHQTEGGGPGSHCLLVNLSQDVIHVQCVRAVSVSAEGESAVPLGADADLTHATELGPVELENTIRQGPLRQGDFIRLGSFEEILEKVVGASPAEGHEWLGPNDVPNIKRIEIRVTAVYGRSDRSVGASRRFELVTRDDLLKVRPMDTYTTQLYKRRDRKRAEQWLKLCQE